MRFSILLAGAALSLAACGNNDAADNTINADESLSAESFSSNDLTAIDAVTGEASNMAADVEFVVEADNAVDTDSAPGKAATPKRPSGETARSNAAEPAPEPAANATAAATSNNAL